MERDGNGRFGKGNAGGPGRPKRNTEVLYLRILMDECDSDTWRSIAKSAVEDAKNGDYRAREWLSKHLMGIPKGEAPDLTTVHLEELSDVDPIMVASVKQHESDCLDKLQAFGASVIED